MFYKIGVNLEKIFESIFSGWKGLVFTISIILAFLLWRIDILKSEFSKMTFFILVFLLILLLYQKYSKIFDFIQNSIVTFMITYGFISVVVVAPYYLAIKMGVIDLISEETQQNNNIELIIVGVLMSVVLFSFKPTSLIVKGYMQRYDEKWKIYNSNNVEAIFLAASLFVMSISSAWLIWIEYMILYC